MKRSLLLIVLLAALRAPIAGAEPPNRQATAQALLERGREDLQAGNLEQAFRELAESVDILPDSAARSALAECHLALGRLPEAWALWHDLAGSAPTAELRDEAARNAAAVDQLLARVAVRLRAAAPADLVVTFNGKAVNLRELTARRLPPGTLVVAAMSPETQPWTRTFQLEAGTALELEIPLVPSPRAVGRQQIVKGIGLSLTGAGTIAIGTGAVFGIVAYSDWRSASSACGGNTDHCKSAGFASAQRDLDAARRAARISSWSTGIGTTALALGLLVYYLRDTGPETATAWRASPLVGAQTVGIVLSGSLP